MEFSPSEHHEKIDKLFKDVNIKTRELYRLIDDCKHEITSYGIDPIDSSKRMHELLGLIPTSALIEVQINDPLSWSGSCWICGKDFGWYCPDSPDHICDYHYNGEDGNVGYNPDCCKYCHQPDERK
jgi:hypothetical protein